MCGICVKQGIVSIAFAWSVTLKYDFAFLSMFMTASIIV